MVRHCKGIRRNGEPCQSTALDQDGYCFAHAPGNDLARQSARAKGGKNRSSAARALKAIPADLDDLRAGLLEAFAETKDGTLKPGVAMALSALARAIVTVYEAGEYETRIAELEDHLNEVREA